MVRVRTEKPKRNFISNSLKVFDEKAKNFLKNSTKKVLANQISIKGKVITDIKNINHTKTMSFDIHLTVMINSKKLDKEIKMRAKNKKPLKEIIMPPTPKNLNSLEE